MVIDITRVCNGLVYKRDTFPGGPIAFFSAPSETTFIAKNIVYLFQTLLGDGVLVRLCEPQCESSPRLKSETDLPLLCRMAVLAHHRVPHSLVVLDRRRVTSPYVGKAALLSILLPPAAAGAIAIHASSTVPEGSGTVFVTKVGQWITAFYASTLATNFLVSSTSIHPAQIIVPSDALPTLSSPWIQNLEVEPPYVAHAPRLASPRRPRHSRRGTPLLRDAHRRARLLRAEVQRPIHPSRHRTSSFPYTLIHLTDRTAA